MRTKLSRAVEKDVVDRLLGLLAYPEHWTVEPLVIRLDRKLHEARVTEGDFEKKMSRIFNLGEDIQFWRGMGGLLHFKLWQPEISFRFVPWVKLWWGVRKMLVAKLSEKRDHTGKALIWQLNRAADRAKEPPPEPMPIAMGQTTTVGPLTLGSSVSTQQQLLHVWSAGAPISTHVDPHNVTWLRIPGSKEMGEI